MDRARHQLAIPINDRPGQIKTDCTGTAEGNKSINCSGRLASPKISWTLIAFTSWLPWPKHGPRA
eukprot:7286197-Lingulodinium_polyedra.AAC.1